MVSNVSTSASTSPRQVRAHAAQYTAFSFAREFHRSATRDVAPSDFQRSAHPDSGVSKTESSSGGEGKRERPGKRFSNFRLNLRILPFLSAMRIGRGIASTTARERSPAGLLMVPLERTDRRGSGIVNGGSSLLPRTEENVTSRSLNFQSKFARSHDWRFYGVGHGGAILRGRKIRNCNELQR